MNNCVQCGKETNALIDDLCADCHMRNWFEGLQGAPLQRGDVVRVTGNFHRGKRGVVSVGCGDNWQSEISVLINGDPLKFKRTDVTLVSRGVRHE